VLDCGLVNEAVALRVSTPEETAFFYHDYDTRIERLQGSRSQAVTFPPPGLPPVRSFWWLILCSEHHFFPPNGS